MVEVDDIETEFVKLYEKLSNLNKEIENFVPRALVKKVSSFGNSSHVVLSKDLVNKKVGVIVLGEEG